MKTRFVVAIDGEVENPCSVCPPQMHEKWISNLNWKEIRWRIHHDLVNVSVLFNVESTLEWKQLTPFPSLLTGKQRGAASSSSFVLRHHHYYSQSVRRFAFQRSDGIVPSRSWCGTLTKKRIPSAPPRVAPKVDVGVCNDGACTLFLLPSHFCYTYSNHKKKKHGRRTAHKRAKTDKTVCRTTAVLWKII